MTHGELILYTAEDGSAAIQLRAEGGTVWLTQVEIATLFDTTPQNITQHTKAIYAEGELAQGATCKELLQVRHEGGRAVNRTLKHYNLDMILAVGYRVRSPRGAQFRQRSSRRYRNRRIGEFLKELEMTEGRSTGIPKILKEMAANGSPAPRFETDDDRLSFVIRLPCHPLARATPEVTRLLGALRGEMSRENLMSALGLRDQKYFREAYLKPALAAKMTLPDIPRSSKQRFRLTAIGRQWLSIAGEEAKE